MVPVILAPLSDYQEVSMVRLGPNYCRSWTGPSSFAAWPFYH